MERNHILGMICGYYLSKFDLAAYQHLGFSSQQATHAALGAALDVPAESIKNWRDEFDPVHDNGRAGWRNRDMYPSRRRVIEALGDLSEPELLELVRHFTASPAGAIAERVVTAVDGTRESDGTARDDDTISLRGVTGARAEEAFRAYHEKRGRPLAGQLIDRRVEQCGFDFEIAGPAGRAYVEVKGLAGNTGGVTLTDREWRTAKLRGDEFFLAIVRNAHTEPDIALIQDPATLLEAEMRTYTVLQVGWSVSAASLKKVTERRNEESQ